MRYLYFPGCSLKSTGRAYEESLLPVFEALDSPLVELADWNCCGATAYFSVEESKAFALAGRNIALAEKQTDGYHKSPGGKVDLVAPCSACFLVLLKTMRYLGDYPHVKREVCDSLHDAGLECMGQVAVRHPIDVLVNDIGLPAIRKAVKQQLKGLKVASYYGCQLVRPFATFDHAMYPTTMDTLVEVLGGTPVDWPLKTRCCGGSLTGTITDVGLRLNRILLEEAQKRGADVMITSCPLCQFNLECFQKPINRKLGANVHLPVVFFTQLMGVAFGIDPKTLGLQRLFVPFEYRPAPGAPAGKEAAHA